MILVSASSFSYTSTCSSPCPYDSWSETVKQILSVGGPEAENLSPWAPSFESYVYFD